MEVFSYESVKADTKSPGVKMRVVIGPEQSAPNFVMRVIDLAPGASPHYHAHPWEHEVYVLAGKGELQGENSVTELVEGNVIYIAPNEPHGLSNPGDVPFRFICLIPLSAHGNTADVRYLDS